MGDELRAAARLASDRDRTLSGLDAGEPRTAHGALHDRGKLVESPTLRVLGRVVGAEPIRAADPARAGRRLRRHITPGIRVAAVADRRPAGPGAPAGRSLRSHARRWALGESAGVRMALRRTAGRRGRRARQRARVDGDVALLVHRPTRLGDAAAVAASHPAPPRHSRAVTRSSAASRFFRYGVLRDRDQRSDEPLNPTGELRSARAAPSYCAIGALLRHAGVPHDCVMQAAIASFTGAYDSLLKAKYGISGADTVLGIVAANDEARSRADATWRVLGLVSGARES